MTLARPFYILALAHSWRGVAESFNFNKWCLKIKSPRHCTEHFSRIFWELSWFYQHLESLLCKISVILSTFIYYIYFIKQFVPTIKSIFRIYLAVVALLSRTWTWTRAVSHCTMLIPAPFPFLLMLGMATKKNNKYQTKIVHLENCPLNGMVYSNTFSVCLNFAPDKQKQNKDMTIFMVMVTWSAVSSSSSPPLQLLQCCMLHWSSAIACRAQRAGHNQGKICSTLSHIIFPSIRNTPANKVMLILSSLGRYCYLQTYLPMYIYTLHCTQCVTREKSWDGAMRFMFSVKF